MRMLTFARRTAKEILRDPLTLFFGLGFPIVLLLLMSLIQAHIPVSLFAIDALAPGMMIFGQSFLSLFAAMLVSKDRESAFLQRLYATPMKASDFIWGYTLPFIPIALGQAALVLAVGLMLGLRLSIHLLSSLFISLPSALFFTSLGLLFGSILSSRQTGGICGALLTNLAGWLSGIWFDLSLLGEGLNAFAHVLPFANAVDVQKAAAAGAYADLFPALLWVLLYAGASLILASFLFLRQMKKQ